MTSPVDDQPDHNDNVEEQQALLQPDSNSVPTMTSDVARSDGRPGDRPASAVVWVRSALFAHSYLRILNPSVGLILCEYIFLLTPHRV